MSDKPSRGGPPTPADGGQWIKELEAKRKRGELPTAESVKEPDVVESDAEVWPQSWPNTFVRRALNLELHRYLRELAQIYNGELPQIPFFKAALDAWGGRDNTYDGIVLFGGEGTGKSVTALALCLQLSRAKKDWDFLDAGEFADLWATQDRPRIANLKKCGLLVVDEIGDSLDMKGPAFGLMKRVINARYRNDLPVALATTDGEEAAKEAIGPELFDRFPNDMQIGSNEESCRP